MVLFQPAEHPLNYVPLPILRTIKVGPGQACVAWRAAGSPAVFGSGRSNGADVARHSLCLPVTSDCVCMDAPAYQEFAPDPATTGHERYRWFAPAKE